MAETLEVLHPVFDTLLFKLLERDHLGHILFIDQLNISSIRDGYLNRLKESWGIQAFEGDSIYSLLTVIIVVIHSFSEKKRKILFYIPNDESQLMLSLSIADLLLVPFPAHSYWSCFHALSLGIPAVTFPAGFSAPSPSAPLGVPIGGELLGLDYTEDKLLAYAYAIEQAAGARKPPVSTPPLPNEP